MIRRAKKTAAQLDREIAIATARSAEQKLAAIARTRRPTQAETQDALRAYAAAASVTRSDLDDDKGVFYLTDAHERPLGPEFPTRGSAKRAAMKLVREEVHPRVEVWHRWRGDRYMQGLASEEGWSDV
jgi:hypothetical protein